VCPAWLVAPPPVPVVSHADINARTTPIPAIPVNVSRFFICLVLNGLVNFWLYRRLHLRWFAALLSRDGLLISVELALFPNVDLILRRSGKHVKQLLVERHGRTPALGKSLYCLLLFRSRDRYDLKTRLGKPGLFPGDFTPAGGNRFGCGY